MRAMTNSRPGCEVARRRGLPSPHSGGWPIRGRHDAFRILRCWSCRSSPDSARAPFVVPRLDTNHPIRPVIADQSVVGAVDGAIVCWHGCAPVLDVHIAVGIASPTLVCASYPFSPAPIRPVQAAVPSSPPPPEEQSRQRSASSNASPPRPRSRSGRRNCDTDSLDVSPWRPRRRRPARPSHRCRQPTARRRADHRRRKPACPVVRNIDITPPAATTLNHDSKPRPRGR